MNKFKRYSKVKIVCVVCDKDFKVHYYRIKMNKKFTEEELLWKPD